MSISEAVAYSCLETSVSYHPSVIYHYSIFDCEMELLKGVRYFKGSLGYV